MTTELLDRNQRATKAELLAAFNVLTGVAEAVRQAGQSPSGTLYAVLCGKVSLEGYQGILRRLTGAGLVRVDGDLVKWVGPTILGVTV